MTEDISALYQKIAQGVVDALPNSGWTSATYIFMGITMFSEEQGHYLAHDNSKKYYIAGATVNASFNSLRALMSVNDDENRVWYTSIFTTYPEGKFKFDFIYDELPKFEVIPSQDKWAHEFNEYPNPKLMGEIPKIPK